jgi:hypothetical protein
VSAFGMDVRIVRPIQGIGQGFESLKTYLHE